MGPCKACFRLRWSCSLQGSCSMGLNIVASVSNPIIVLSTVVGPVRCCLGAKLVCLQTWRTMQGYELHIDSEIRVWMSSFAWSAGGLPNHTVEPPVERLNWLFSVFSAQLGMSYCSQGQEQDPGLFCARKRMILARRKPCLFRDIYSNINKPSHILSRIGGLQNNCCFFFLRALTKESDEHTFELTVFVVCFMIKTLT